MTILSVVKDVCATVGVTLPQSLFSGITGNRTAQEMLSLANEMAQRIAYDTRDWTFLRTVIAIPGDGVSSGFNLPGNYKRLLLTTNMRRSSAPIMPLMFVPDPDEWQERRLRNYTRSPGEWIIQGGQIYTSPILPIGDNLHFTYLDKNCINLASGGRGDSFMSDNDSFVLDERCLKLGMIWQWKAQKGAPYAEDMGTYADALTYAMGKDSPAPIIIGGRPISANAQIAIPSQTIVVPGMVP